MHLMFLHIKYVGMYYEYIHINDHLIFIVNKNRGTDKDSMSVYVNNMHTEYSLSLHTLHKHTHTHLH